MDTKHRCTNCGAPMRVVTTFTGGDASENYGELLECAVCGETWIDRNATPPRYEVVNGGVDVFGRHVVEVRRVWTGKH